LPHLMAGLPVSRRSMLVMAVRALDQALVDAMPEGHIELGFLLQVARVAKIGLRLDQQLFLCSRMVRGVAIGAAHVVLAVEGIRAIEVRWPGSMAGEALLVDHLRGCGFRPEIKDEFLRGGIFRVVALRLKLRIGVRLARSVAPIAIGRGARLSQLGSRMQLGCVRVGRPGNLFDRGLVTMLASLYSGQLADIGLTGSLSGNDGGCRRARLLLSECHAGSHRQQGQS